MEPKRFIGSDVNRLFARIRREIGPDALVLRTRSLLREGAEPLVEILAAPATEPDSLPPVVQRAMIHSVLARLDPSATVGDVEDMLARGAFDSPTASPGPLHILPVQHQTQAFDEDGLFDQLAAELARRAPALVPPQRPEARAVPRFGDRDLTASSVVANLRGRLQEAGFSSLAIESVMETAPTASDAVHAVASTLEGGVLAYPDEDQTAILTVQGATGTGRTTALLRMALDCVRAGRPACLVSLAGESPVAHLKGFARDAGVEFATAKDWHGVGKLARRATLGTCLFLDVPPGPWRMPLPVGIRHFRYLALPAFADAASLGAALEPFDLRPFSGAVLTNGDRAVTLRPAVDFLIRSGLGVAFVSDGPDPSTGIALADAFMLASGCFTTATGVGTDVAASAFA